MASREGWQLCTDTNVAIIRSQATIHARLNETGAVWG
jgi:hypothetical protein